ncbi:PAS domain-containing protein [Blastococcus sp. CCUG 61487]|uniref:PAS domain-containing protein n=1 Tax=Blastococcus sp. CCUG 61487 TaxID=1840703 RepID=UPI001485A80F|nr:PAS domain-containing protein [Blastococcus sp. CCUG 61487]
MAEHELQEHWETIDLLLRAEQQRRALELADTLPLAILQTDATGVVTHANPAAARLFGLPAARLPGKGLSALLDTAADRCLLRQRHGALNSGEVTEVQLDVIVRGPDGRTPSVRLFGWKDTTAPTPTLTRWLGIELTSDAPAPSAPTPPRDVDKPGTTATAMAQAFARLALLPATTEDEQGLLRRIEAVVRGAVPGATSMSISVGPPSEPGLVAAEDATAQLFNGKQIAAGEGPCQDAHDCRTVVMSADITVDERWPRLRTLLTEVSVRSVLVVPVRLPEERPGALSVYSDRLGVFTDGSSPLGELLPAAVTAILSEAAERSALRRVAANLATVLTSRLSWSVAGQWTRPDRRAVTVPPWLNVQSS